MTYPDLLTQEFWVGSLGNGKHNLYLCMASSMTTEPCGTDYFYGGYEPALGYESSVTNDSRLLTKHNSISLSSHQCILIW